MWVIFLISIWYIMGGRSGEDIIVGLVFSFFLSWVLQRRDIHTHLGDVIRTIWKFPLTYLRAVLESLILTICFFCPLRRRISHKHVHVKDIFSETINTTATPTSIVFDYDSQSGELYIHEVLVKWKP